MSDHEKSVARAPDRAGSYGSIKAISLTEMGRFDEVAGAIDQEVTDDDHPFGQAMASFARSFYLTRLGAWEPAAESLANTIERATALSRVWMLNCARSLQATVGAHLRAAGRGGSAVVVDGRASDDVRLGRTFTGKLSMAEVALIEGRPAEAMSLAAPIVERDTGEPNSAQVRALDLMARSLLDLGELDDAAVVAERGLGIAESMSFGALIWRLRQVRALALGLPVDDAAAEFSALANRISEPEIRSWFERQQLPAVGPHSV